MGTISYNPSGNEPYDPARSPLSEHANDLLTNPQVAKSPTNLIWSERGEIEMNERAMRANLPAQERGLIVSPLHEARLVPIRFATKSRSSKSSR